MHGRERPDEKASSRRGTGSSPTEKVQCRRRHAPRQVGINFSWLPQKSTGSQAEEFIT